MTNQEWGFLVGWTLIAMIAALMAYAFWINDPRHVERAMAKKLERKRIADILTVALDTAYRQEFITAKVMQKYSKQVGKAMGLPDMIPRKPFNLKSALQSSRKRLDAMGVNIADGLKKIRRSRPSKQERAIRALKKAS